MTVILLYRFYLRSSFIPHAESIAVWTLTGSGVKKGSWKNKVTFIVEIALTILACFNFPEFVKVAHF